MACKPIGPTCDYAVIERSCPSTCAPFEFDAAESCFFDGIAAEQVQVAGTEIRFWHQDISNSVRDPLYDEPINRAWCGPFVMKAFVDYATENAEAREEGTRVVWSGSLWVPRSEIETAAAPAPLEGDVIQYWHNTGFYEKHSVLGADEPGAGYYFDVINVELDGYLFTSPLFVGFKLQLSRRTEFTAERRLRE